MKIQTQDIEFVARLKEHLKAKNGGNPTAPFRQNADGSVNREKTLAMTGYEGMQAQECKKVKP